MGTGQDLTEPGYLRDVFRSEDNLALAPTGMRKPSGSSTITEPPFAAAHERRGFGRFKKLQIHDSPLSVVPS